MSMRDEIREQHKKLKGRSRKEKLEYFWEYYKVHTFVVLITLFFLFILIRDIATSKDDAFCAVLLNAYGHNEQAAFQEDFAAYAGIDTEEYYCNLDTSSTLSLDIMSEINIAVSQRMVAMAQGGQLDILGADPEVFAYYAQGGLFQDMREVLTPEEMKKYQDYFYYIDAGSDSSGTRPQSWETGAASSPEDKSPSKDPHSMTNPVPVGISLEESDRLLEWNCYTASGEPPVIGFVYSGQRRELCRLFLSYLWE